MPIKKQLFYQGRDWFSENWTVAQTYKALDQIHDLCLYQSKNMDSSSLFESQLSLISMLMTHIDLLHKGLTHLIEELIPTQDYTYGPEKCWIVYELKILEKKINKSLTDLSEKNETTTLRNIQALTLAIKLHIRKLDQ